MRDDRNIPAMKNTCFSLKLNMSFLLLVLSVALSAQSVREGVNEANFNLVSAEDFDFAGVWQANRFEVVYDTAQKKVVLFEFRDSIPNIVFVRLTGVEDIKAYDIEPLEHRTGFPYARIGLIDSSFICIGSARDSSYSFNADLQLYGLDAVQFNEDVPESNRFFGRKYEITEDLNVFWELIRVNPQ